MMRKEEGDGGAVVLHIIIFDGTLRMKPNAGHSSTIEVFVYMLQ